MRLGDLTTEDYQHAASVRAAPGELRFFTMVNGHICFDAQAIIVAKISPPRVREAKIVPLRPIKDGDENRLVCV